MPFDFSTLITDRSPGDLQALRYLLATPMADWTAEQLAEFNRAASKGAYNYTDLNRVIAAMDDINERLTSAGYETGYQRIQVPHQGGGRLPARYTELQYIESSGTQYIETGFTPNQDSRVICEFQLLDAYTSIRGVFGVRDSASGTAAQQFILWNNGVSSFRTDYFGSQETLSSLSAQAQYTADKNRNVTTMGGQSVTNPSASGQCTNNLVIFGVNNAGTVEYLSAMRLYACQVYDNGALILNLVPCEDPDGDIGLYDLVSAQFMGNSGGGVFSAGPELPPTEPERDPYTWYEDDTPTASLMDEYITNVATLRAVLDLPETIPAVPAGMDRLTQAEANDIEIILDMIDAYFLALQTVFLRSGMAWAVTGGPSFYFAN